MNTEELAKAILTDVDDFDRLPMQILKRVAEFGAAGKVGGDLEIVRTVLLAHVAESLCDLRRVLHGIEQSLDAANESESERNERRSR